jgi:hypothetical protein
VLVQQGRSLLVRQRRLGAPESHPGDRLQLRLFRQLVSDAWAHVGALTLGCHIVLMDLRSTATPGVDYNGRAPRNA